LKNILSERLNELELAPLKNQELPWWKVNSQKE
jgi:hypothetical protein